MKRLLGRLSLCFSVLIGGFFLLNMVFGATTTYTFSGISNPSGGSKAETGTTGDLVVISTKTPGVETEFTTNEYSSITVSDDVRQNFDAGTISSYPVHDFIFKVAETVANITQINYKYEGYGCRGSACSTIADAQNFWWDVNISTWIFVGSSTAIDQLVQYSTTTNISNFFDTSGNMYIRAQGPRRNVSSFSDQIRTDYVEIVITYTPSSNADDMFLVHYAPKGIDGGGIFNGKHIP